MDFLNPNAMLLDKDRNTQHTRQRSDRGNKHRSGEGDKEAQDGGTTNRQVALVLESPSSTSMKKLPCDAERDSGAGRYSGAGRTSDADENLANFLIDN